MNSQWEFDEVLDRSCTPGTKLSTGYLPSLHISIKSPGGLFQHYVKLCQQEYPQVWKIRPVPVV